MFENGWYILLQGISWGAPQQHPSNQGMVRPMGNVLQGGVGYPVNQHPSGIRMPPMGMPPQPGMQPMGSFRGMMPTQQRSSAPANKRGQDANKQPTSSLDLLGQDFLQTQKQQQKQKQSVSPVPYKKAGATEESLLSLSNDNSPTMQQMPASPHNADTTLPTKPPTTTSSNMASDTLVSLDNDDIAALSMTKVSSEPAPLDDVFVALDTVVPGKPCDHKNLIYLMAFIIL